MEKLSVVLGRYPHMQALRDRTVRSDRVEFEFTEFKAVGAAFNDMLLDQRYDVCEMALVAFMQAAERGVPVRMLPVVALGGFVHGCLYYHPGRGPLSPTALAGKRIGVRSYSQTTGVWARGILAEQYGLDIASATWVATDEAHVAGFEDPPYVHNLGTRQQVGDLLLDGTVDAGVLHPTQKPAPELAPLIPDPEGAARQWFGRHRIVPVNHVVCVAPRVWQDPALLAQVQEMLARSYRAAGVPAATDDHPVSYGHTHLTRALSLASDIACAQHLLGAPFRAQEGRLVP